MITLVAGGEHVVGVAVDALASLALAAVLVLVATRGELVAFPEDAMGRQPAAVFGDLLDARPAARLPRRPRSSSRSAS